MVRKPIASQGQWVLCLKDKMKTIAIGDVCYTKRYGVAEVIELCKKSKCKIRFLSTGFETLVLIGNFKRGSIKDPHARTIHGVGYIGIGDYSTIDYSHKTKRSRAYIVWRHMLQRCYDEKLQQKAKSYKGCTVDDDWHCFQNFAKWYLSQSNWGTHEIDKDLLVSGNKTYSEATCTLLPKNLNIALQEKRANGGKYPAGVYFKKANNNYIAQLACGDGIQKHLGSFSSSEEARDTYVKAKKEQIRILSEKYKNVITEEALLALQRWEPVE